MNIIKKRTTLFFTLLCTVISYSLALTTKEINFSHLTLNDGLSQNTVYSIAQDKRSNMWFATHDGLNRYDGYAFTVYRHNPASPNSIANDIILTLHTDSQGRVWVGTQYGLSLYNEDKDNFHNYAYQQNGKNAQVTSIITLSPQQLLVGTTAGVLLFDTQSAKFLDNVLPSPMHQLVPTTLAKEGDEVYVGTNSGLYSYNLGTQKLQVPSQTLNNKQIQFVLKQSPTRLWVATQEHGLYLINPHTGHATSYQHQASNNQSISSNTIHALALDDQNRLWIGTPNGLNIYQESTNTFTTYTSNPGQVGSLSHQSVLSIFVDSQGGIWLGTSFGGLNYHHPLQNRFQNISHIPHHNSLNDNVVSCIVEDANQNLWIGTHDGGLNHYNPITKHFTHYTLPKGNAKSTPLGSIKSIYVEPLNHLVYIGSTTGGLSVLTPKTGQIEQLSTPNNLKKINHIVPDDANHLWLATPNGLEHYNPSTRTFATILHTADGTPIKKSPITTLYRDNQHRLWVGSEDGLTTYTTHKGALRTVTVLPAQADVLSAFINNVYQATNGTFWISTRQGLYSYNEKTHEYHHYTTTQGLPSNVLYGILEESSGRLWISSNQGLTCFDPKTQKFRNYTHSDGLQSNQFNPSSHCRTTGGQFYFGGIHGITSFRPELITDNPYTPPVTITNLRLFNKEVRPDDDTGILHKTISNTDGITLTAAQSTISLDFSVPNYISGPHNTFAYKLDGYDKEWYYLTNQRSASYTNLPPGHYQFLVKAANSDGKWNDVPTLLHIHILPVWYKTWWAILLFVALFAGFITFAIRFFWLRKSTQTQLEVERINKEQQEEVNQMKMNFFINLSHELRTPLTLILAPLQEMINRINDQWTRNQLNYIQRNANRLLHLVNQLMDYRRAELGVFPLQVQPTNAYQLVKENFQFYDKLAAHKNIQYTLHSDLQEQEVLLDPNYLALILNNLLSNAFKYTEAGQSITVTLRLTADNLLLLQVADTGLGIPLNKQGSVFERYYQIESEYVGSGIGLSLVQRLVGMHHGHIDLQSEPGSGSTFSIYLPQTPSLYSASEFVPATTDTPEEHNSPSTNSPEMYLADALKPNDEMIESTDKQRGTILIVEDNQEILQYLNNGLSHLFNTLQAPNGQVALELLKEHDVDLIITDVMMPDMDGIKLCKAVKQNIRTCHIPVMMLSAKTDVKDQMEALQVGADDYIPKPFILSIITTKIQNMLRTRHRMLDRYSTALDVEPEKITFNTMDEELLKRAVSIVEKNIDNIEFTTDEFAREMNMSRSNLHLKFKAITGESTIDFIRKIRFAEACKLLKEGRYSVAEVSSMVGFNTPSYFATSFKKHLGCLPSEYIKQFKA